MIVPKMGSLIMNALGSLWSHSLHPKLTASLLVKMCINETTTSVSHAETTAVLAMLWTTWRMRREYASSWLAGRSVVSICASFGTLHFGDFWKTSRNSAFDVWEDKYYIYLIAISALKMTSARVVLFSPSKTKLDHLSSRGIDLLSITLHQGLLLWVHFILLSYLMGSFWYLSKLHQSWQFT